MKEKETVDFKTRPPMAIDLTLEQAADAAKELKKNPGSVEREDNPRNDV